MLNLKQSVSELEQKNLEMKIRAAKENQEIASRSNYKFDMREELKK